MSKQKIFVTGDKKGTIVCPNCMTRKTISVASLLDKLRFKVKCTCNYVMDIELEFRKKIRKETNLVGFYEPITEKTKWGKVKLGSISAGINLGAIAVDLNDPDIKSGIHKPQGDGMELKPNNCTIQNISTEGIGLLSVYRPQVKPGQTLRIVLILDNSTRSIIEKKVIVRVREIKDNYIGCEFVDAHKDDKTIRCYTL